MRGPPRVNLLRALSLFLALAVLVWLAVPVVEANATNLLIAAAGEPIGLWMVPYFVALLAVAAAAVFWLKVARTLLSSKRT